MEDSSEPYEPDTDNTGGGRFVIDKSLGPRAICPRTFLYRTDCTLLQNNLF